MTGWNSTYSSQSDFLVEEFLDKEGIAVYPAFFLYKDCWEKRALSSCAPLFSSPIFVPQWIFLSALMVSISKASESSLPLLWDFPTRISLLSYSMSPYLPFLNYVDPTFLDCVKSFLSYRSFILHPISGEDGVACMHSFIFILWSFFLLTQRPRMLIRLYFYVAFLSHIYVLLATHHATVVVNAL